MAENSEEGSEREGFFIGVRTALIVVFILGLTIGLSGGLMASSLAESSTSNKKTINNSIENEKQQENTKESGKVDLSKINNSDDPVLGDKDSEVTMVIYEDLECAFCARFENNAFRSVKENYVDSGDVKVVWKDFPLSRIHPWAVKASETMECVYRQDEDVFWQVKEKIFASQESISRENVEEKILNWSTVEGVQKESVKSCLEEGAPEESVKEDFKEGQSFEAEVGGSPFVSGTPATVIYSEGDDEGVPLVGAQPYSRFKTVIESKLS